MVEIKKISFDEFKIIASGKSFNMSVLEKDYFVTLVLYLLKDVKGIYFKGGTALQKIFLGYSRLSEDVDYTVEKDFDNVREEIKYLIMQSGFFEDISKDKDVTDFVRLIVHYKGFSGKDGTVFIDLNKRAELQLKPERHEVRHFYSGFIPSFSVNTLAKEEMIAEKVAAAIGRNKPRDHYDVYQIIKHNFHINMNLVRKKCELSNNDSSIIKMFNNAKKLKNRWDSDLVPLLAKETSFKEVMQTLAKHFNLKEAKEDLRKND
jgi:predicted nucleotidyltransferase component of viral defense system